MPAESSAPTTGSSLTIDGLDGVEHVRSWNGPQPNAKAATTQVYSQPNNGATTTLGGKTVAEVGPYNATLVIVGEESIRAAKEIARGCVDQPHELDITVTETSAEGGTSSITLLDAFITVQPNSLTANSNGIQEITINIEALGLTDDQG